MGDAIGRHGNRVAGLLAPYRSLFRNRAFRSLWAAGSISAIGDDFFYLATLWVVYAQSRSMFDTALVGLAWHIRQLILGPFGGLIADRANRKGLLVASSLLSVPVTALLALWTARGPLTPTVAIVAVVLLNGIGLLAAPAGDAVLSEVLGRDAYITGQGVRSSMSAVLSTLSTALAGIVIAAFGAATAFGIDAVTFVLAAGILGRADLPAFAPVPKTVVAPGPGPAPSNSLRGASLNPITSIRDDLLQGWQAVMGHPVVRPLVLIATLANVVSFTAVMFPALTRILLHGNAETLGALEAAASLGAVSGGVLAGPIEHRLGAGISFLGGLSLTAGIYLGLGLSHAWILSASLMGTYGFAMAVAGTSLGALHAVLIPEGVRGRASGLIGSLAVLAIAPALLVGGFRGDRVGPGPMFVVAGLWTLGTAVWGRSDGHIRRATVTARTGGADASISPESRALPSLPPPSP